MIEHKRIKGLSFDDILIPPVYSTIRSRSEPDTTTQVGPITLKIPFISSPMDTVTESAMAIELGKLGGLGVIHRFMDPEAQAEECQKVADAGRYVVPAIGVGESERQRLEFLMHTVDEIDMVSIDVANGHSILMEEMVGWVKERYPSLPIMAGNIATFHGYEFMIGLGVDAVRVGIGGGCEGPESRLLMADGTTKRIVDIIPGDMVINKFGKPVRVKRLINSGYKKVIKVKTSAHSEPIYITPDHQCWVGDLSERQAINKIGKSRTLNKPNKNGSSKVKWLPIGDAKLKHTLGLTPKNIAFELPEEIVVPINMYAKSVHSQTLPKEIRNTYNLGYLFGFFLGDGSCINERQVVFYIGKNEHHYLDKLSKIIKDTFGINPTHHEEDNLHRLTINSRSVADLFLDFGKGELKNLPKRYRSKNKEYVKGIFDGLVDSDGWTEEYGRECFSNISRDLVELFNFCCMILGKSFSNSYREPKMGGLKNTHQDSIKPSYVAKTHTSNRFFKDPTDNNEYSYAEILSIDEVPIDIETWDIEVDCDTHSFITNNICTHNSICKTRIQTSVGIPTLSSVVDCARARHKFQYYNKNNPNMKFPSIVADGGIRYPSDVVKSIIGGADAVMCGGVFAGTDESPSELVYLNEVPHKKYRGMASASVQKDRRGGLKEGTCSEGVTTYIPYTGSLQSVLYGDDGFVGGLKSGMSYLNTRTIKELQEFDTYITITPASLNESHAYGTKK